MKTIDSITECAAQIHRGEHSEVKPGMSVRMSEAAAPQDSIRQGDLYLTVALSVPEGYIKASKPNVQLVPGNTKGARHCLDSLEGVTMYYPPGFETAGDSWNAMEGPVLELSKERKVLHPTHGHVTIPAGFTVGCTYQREWDQEQRRERRNAD